MSQPLEVARQAPNLEETLQPAFNDETTVARKTRPTEAGELRAWRFEVSDLSVLQKSEKYN